MEARVFEKLKRTPQIAFAIDKTLSFLPQQEDCLSPVF